MVRRLVFMAYSFLSKWDDELWFARDILVRAAKEPADSWSCPIVGGNLGEKLNLSRHQGGGQGGNQRTFNLFHREGRKLSPLSIRAHRRFVCKNPRILQAIFGHYV